MRSSEAPVLRKMPSEYMKEMYYTCQPMETDHMKALEVTFEMINAKTQLLYASDWPHYDFDTPSVIWGPSVPRRGSEAQHPGPEREADLQLRPVGAAAPSGTRSSHPGSAAGFPPPPERQTETCDR